MYLVGVLGEPRHAGEEVVTAADDTWTGLLPFDDIAQERATGPTVMRRRHLRLARHGGVDERPGVDLTVRVRVRRADDRPAVLEDQHVRHTLLRLERLGPVAPGRHDSVNFVVGEVGHRPFGVVVIADDLGRAGGAHGPVDVVAVRRLGRPGREHGQVVGEHEHALVVGIRGGDAPPAGRQRVVGRHEHFIGSDGLSDPRARVAVSREQHPLASEGMPPQLPGHGSLPPRAAPSGSVRITEMLTLPSHPGPRNATGCQDGRMRIGLPAPRCFSATPRRPAGGETTTFVQVVAS